MRIVLLCLLCLSGLSGPAFSLPVVLDFTLAPDDFQEIAQIKTTVAGLNLDITADSVGRSFAEITWSNGYGLGVRAEAESAKTLDGSGGDDLLTFSLDSSIRLLAVEYARVNDYDRFELLLGDDVIVDDFIDTAGDAFASYDLISQQILTDSFSIKAVDSKASFRVKSITVGTIEAPLPAPEPATWILLGVGWPVLVWMRKKT